MRSRVTTVLVCLTAFMIACNGSPVQQDPPSVASSFEALSTDIADRFSRFPSQSLVNIGDLHNQILCRFEATLPADDDRGTSVDRFVTAFTASVNAVLDDNKLAFHIEESDTRAAFSLCAWFQQNDLFDFLEPRESDAVIVLGHLQARGLLTEPDYEALVASLKAKTANGQSPGVSHLVATSQDILNASRSYWGTRDPGVATRAERPPLEHLDEDDLQRIRHDVADLLLGVTGALLGGGLAGLVVGSLGSLYFTVAPLVDNGTDGTAAGPPSGCSCCVHVGPCP